MWGGGGFITPNIKGEKRMLAKVWNLMNAKKDESHR